MCLTLRAAMQLSKSEIPLSRSGVIPLLAPADLSLRTLRLCVKVESMNHEGTKTQSKSTQKRERG